MSQAALKEALSKTVKGIQDNPVMSRVVFEAQTALVEGVRCSGNVRNFSAITVDEPPELGGGDKGANPVELLLVSLGTCQEIMYAALASAMDIPLDSVRIELKGNMNFLGLMGMGEGKIPPGFQDISYETHLQSTADEKTLQMLVDAVETQCPILDTLVRSIKVSGKVILNGRSEYMVKAA